jgi:flagella basal body P-ring formation protein FlgA
LSITSLEDDARAQIERSLPSSLHLQDLKVPAVLSSADLVNLSFRSAPKAGRTSVQLIVKDQHGKERKTFAQITLVSRTLIAVAVRPLSAGDVLSASDVRFEEVLGDSAADNFASLLGCAVVRPISAGAQVRAEDVAQPAPLPRGTVLSIIAKSGGIEIAVQGKLERPARRGEVAVARADSSHRLVRGVLRDEHTLIAEGAAQ